MVDREYGCESGAGNWIEWRLNVRRLGVPSGRRSGLAAIQQGLHAPFWRRDNPPKLALYPLRLSFSGTQDLAQASAVWVATS